jgi:hypothetical protein
MATSLRTSARARVPLKPEAALEGCAAQDAATMAARRPATPIRVSVLCVRDGRLAAMTYARASVGT